MDGFFHNWNQICETKLTSPTSRWKVATADEKNMALSGDVEIDSILKSAHSAFKTLFFNKDQRALLIHNMIPHAVFLCDFGAGKILKNVHKYLQAGK